jgi:spore germination cell wall hydrolase CwlJ-like protein
MNYKNILSVVGLLTLTSGYAKAADVNNNQVDCIAQAIYYEANAESYSGKIAVGSVIMNRISSGRYPKTPCGVVYQPRQFSWTSQKRKGFNSSSIRELAQKIYNRDIKDNTGGALMFHNRTVSPKWGKLSRRTTVIGNHLFYR